MEQTGRIGTKQSWTIPMTTFTSEDREHASPRIGSRWVGSTTREEFTVLAVWNPNEENDPWIKYSSLDDREFTCRLEAFLSRFSKLPE
jgi:hypothetical protein